MEDRVVLKKIGKILGQYIIYIFIICVAFILNSVNGLLGWDPLLLKIFHKSNIYGNQLGLILIIVSIILMLLYWLAYHLELKHKNNWNFKQEVEFNWRSIIIAIGGFIIIAISQFIVMHLLNKPSANQSEIRNIVNNAGQIFELNLIIIAPIAEELIFRGMFFNTFFTRPTTFNLWVGSVVNGFLFGYIHAGLSIQIISYWIMGIIFSFIYLYTKDIKYSMLTHIFNNALAAILMIV